MLQELQSESKKPNKFNFNLNKLTSLGLGLFFVGLGMRINMIKKLNFSTNLNTYVRCLSKRSIYLPLLLSFYWVSLYASQFQGDIAYTTIPNKESTFSNSFSFDDKDASTKQEYSIFFDHTVAEGSMLANRLPKEGGSVDGFVNTPPRTYACPTGAAITLHSSNSSLCSSGTMMAAHPYAICNTYVLSGTLDGERDRGAANNDLNRDLIFADNYTFTVTFDNPTAVVIETTIGDAAAARSGTVTVDGVVQSVSTPINSFQTVTHYPSPNNSYSITMVGTDISVTHIVFKDLFGNMISGFDFGTGTSPLEPNYNRVQLSSTTATNCNTYSYAWSVPSGESAPGDVANFSTSTAGTYTVTITDSSDGCTATATSTLTAVTAPSLSIVSDPSCANTVTASVSGGAGPYTYQWTTPAGVSNPGDTDSFAAFVSGTYNVTVTDDNGCVVEEQVLEEEEEESLCALIYALQSTCTDGTANSDGYLQISEITNGDRVNWSVGSTYTGDTNYANATDLTGATFPYIITSGLTNPSGSQDYTIRVFRDPATCGALCYTDVVVTMQEQDCMMGCDCIETIYMNEVSITSTSGGSVHKFQIASDGTLTEILTQGEAWYPGTGTTELPNPHGLGTDLNGRLYIGAYSEQSIRRLTCDGEIAPTSEFEISGARGFNFGSIDNFLYLNPPFPSTETTIEEYDLCTQSRTRSLCLNATNDAGIDWGFYLDPNTDIMYSTASFTGSNVGGNEVFKFTQADFAGSSCIDPFIPGGDNIVTVGDNELPHGSLRGITTDTVGNIYIIQQDHGGTVTGTNRAGRLLKYDANGNFLAATPWDVTDSSTDLEGLYFAIGPVYSETSNTLFISRGDPLSNCLQEYDLNLNDLGGAVGPAPGVGESAKGVAITKECCPTNNNVTIDTTICDLAITNDTILFLQELINCEGIICEGLWQAGDSNSGLTYNSCNNSITINSQTACGTFTLESDGTGNNPQCGAFTITVNIDVITNPTLSMSSDVNICLGETTTLVGVLNSAGSPNYQWQSSTTSCTTGFTDIASAMDSTYAATPIDTTYYRLISSTTASCTSGNCADTSACVTVFPTDLPTATVADVLKCNSDPVTIQISPPVEPGASYNWSGPFSPGNNPGNVPSFTTSIPGTYTVTVTDSEGCTSTASGEVAAQAKICLPVSVTIRQGSRN